ncbi:hypothetical protein [Flavobacterium branchiophilum]|nr:hypothetical protein [Flavobacterium branchiophilum]
MEQYSTSKTRTFDIPGEYKMMQVGPTYTTNTNVGVYRYLNEAVNQALTWNYQRIVILEGEYEVNGAIILDYTNGSTNSLARGRITIEGEGFGTRITNATTYTTGNIFEVRSYYNTTKNLSILSENNNTCLALTTANSTVDVRNNIFENLYIGHKAMNGGTLAPNASLVSNSDASPLDSNPIRVGVYLESSIKQIGYNRFHNIHFFSVDKGIVLTGGNRVHDNIFENFSFENTLVGVDFLSNVNTTDNIFNNLTIQATSYTKNLIRNINGRHNSFMSCNFNDWNSLTAFTPVQNNHSFITITSGAEHTTVQNSEVGRGTVFYLTDGGKYTQLINNYGGNSDVTYRLGNDTSGNASAISKVEVLGEFVSSHDGKNQIYAKNGRTIIGNINPNLLTQINTQDPNTDYKLIVNGKVRVRNEVYVKEAGLTWPDYVFANDYKLMPLQQVAQHIQEKGHLPNMPSATEVEKEGIAVGDIIKRNKKKLKN